MKRGSYTTALRPDVPRDLSNLQFQIIDVHVGKQCDDVIILFGVTNNQNSISVTITDYEHYFYVGTQLNDDFIEKLLQQNKLEVEIEEVTNLRSIFMNHKLKSHYYQVITHDMQTYYKAKSLLQSRPDQFQLYNADIDERVRFFVDCGIVGCGWCRMLEYEVDPALEHPCQLNCVCSYKDLQAIDVPVNAQIRMLSYDIECISQGGFPSASNEENSIIDIGVCAQIQGTDFVENTVFVLGATEPIQTGRIFEFFTESDLLRGFFDYIQQFDPDIITGYNIDNFDWPYVLKRAEMLNIPPKFSRMDQFKVCANPKVFSSNQLGTRESHDVVIPGRVSLDVMPQIMISYKLRSYSLNAVSAEFLHMQKEDVHYSSITPLYKSGAGGRRVLARYCLKDAQLPIHLLDKLMIVFQTFELCKVTGVILNVQLKQGQQIRMISLLARHCKAAGLLIPTKRRAEASAGKLQDENEELEGATVLEPVRGYYGESQPIATLDFNSLYPSIMIAHNLCYSTLLEERDFDLDYFKKRTGQNMTLPELLSSDLVTRTPQGFYFFKASVHEGLLPGILRELLAARKVAKRDMQAAMDPFAIKVLNSRQLALKITANSLYGFTGALQTGRLPSIEISSSVTAFGRQMIELTKQTVEEYYTAGRCVDTEGGEVTLLNDTHVIYGDTDSVMLAFGVSTMSQSFLLAVHAARMVTARFIAPINLDFEKVYCPYLLINKKRYAGLYWTHLDHYDRIDVKGLELVRRDNCQLVPIVMRHVLNCLFLQHSPTEAVRFVKAVVQDLIMGRIDMNLLVISKAYTQALHDYKQEQQAHLSVVRKLRARRFIVNIGDRIQYVIIKTNDKELYKRSEDPQFVIQNNLQIDTDYYLQQQLQKPIARLLGPVLAPKLPPEQAEAEAARILFTGPHTLFSNVKVSQAAMQGLRLRVQKKCIVCGNQDDNQDICNNCTNDVRKIQEKLTHLLAQYRLLEFRTCAVGMECFQCHAGSKDIEEICANKDCEIYFARTQQMIEKQQLRGQIKKLEQYRPQ